MGSYKLKFENGRCCTVEANSKPELILKMKEAEERFSCACKEVAGNFIDVPTPAKSKRKTSTKSKEVIDAENELKKAKSSKISSYIDEASKKLDETYSKDKKFATGGKSESVPRWWNKQVRPYMFFVFNTETNKVWAGNEYQEDAKDELKEFLESNPKLPLKVLTKRAITNKKINPLAYENWARSTEQLDAIRKFALGGMMVANEVSNRLPATTSAIDRRMAERIYSERPSRWEDRGLRYADGGAVELDNLKLTTNEIIILNAVYYSRIDGINGQIDYFKSGNTRWFDEQVRGNKSQEISRLEEKKEEQNDNIKFLKENGYPFDLTNEYDSKKLIRDLNELVRTNRGRELFGKDQPNSTEYYNSYEKLFFKLEDVVEKKYGEIKYAKGGGVREHNGHEYSFGRAWTNDHRHQNLKEDYEVEMYDRKRKYATGGTLGQEITFKHWTGDVRTGSITEDLGNGNFEVSSGFGSVLVNKNDIISGDKKFDTGGSTTDEFEDQMWWVSSRATKGKYTVMRGDYMHFFYSNKEDAIKKARQLNQIWKRK
jgi:hypothetical protein